MMIRKTLAILAVLALVAPAVQADVLFRESFDYGDTTFDIDEGGITEWDTGSGVVMYDHDGGLTSDQLEGEVGGSMHHDYGSGTRGGSRPIPSFDPFLGQSAGNEVWFAGLVEWANQDGESTEVEFSNTSGVNDIGFEIDAGGNINLIAAQGGGAATGHDTGLDATPGEQYLFIVRGTQGSGSSPTDSQVDIWVNPADTSSVAALGTVDYSTGTNGSKFGRSSNEYNGVRVNISWQSRVDELRIGETLNDVAVPEPATMGLLAIGGLGALLKRRR